MVPIPHVSRLARWTCSSTVLVHNIVSVTFAAILRQLKPNSLSKGLKLPIRANASIGIELIDTNQELNSLIEAKCCGIIYIYISTCQEEVYTCILDINNIYILKCYPKAIIPKVCKAFGDGWCSRRRRSQSGHPPGCLFEIHDEIEKLQAEQEGSPPLPQTPTSGSVSKLF